MNNYIKRLVSACTAALAAITVITNPPPARAAGLLVADGGLGGILEIQEHDVAVTINNGVSVTTVTQVFRNTENRVLEALYTFPVPRGASVANFSMWINGKEMVGEVLEKQRAREIYQSYKTQGRDPGLLEQTDFRTFEMRVFPIPAGALQKVQISYYQELEVDHDTATFVYPLATTTRPQVDARVSQRFAFRVDLKSAVPITALESTSHPEAFVVAQHSEHYQQGSLETNGCTLAKDVVLSYQLTRPQTGVDVLTSAQAGQDGYFSVTLTAGQELTTDAGGADYVFVLDTSGSMSSDGKLLLSKDSVGAFIQELRPADRFEVMTFNIQPYLAFQKKRTASEEAKTEALSFLNQARANGGTVLKPALLTAYKYADADRPLHVIVLSDGLTEQHERAELLQLIQSRPRNAKVFCVGVGNDVNRPLLEQMAADAGGLASFISPGDNFQRQAKAFRRKLMNPVATDLQMNFSGAEVYDVEPKLLPNLYHGAPVRIYGRYRGAGEVELKVRGNLNGVEWKESARLSLPAEDDANPEIERMWAWHRIDALLKQGEREGSKERVRPEVVRLGEAYSIVTEHTSFLVLENDQEYQRWKIERRNALRTGRDRQAQARLTSTLAQLRQKALAGLGPEGLQPPTAVPNPTLAQAPVALPPPPQLTFRQAPVPAPPQVQSRNLNTGGGGGGPVGPLFVFFAAWLARQRRQCSQP